MVITETSIQIPVNCVVMNVKHVLEVTIIHVHHAKKEPICMETNVSTSVQTVTMQVLMELAKNVMVTVKHVMELMLTIV